MTSVYDLLNFPQIQLQQEVGRQVAFLDSREKQEATMEVPEVGEGEI